MLRSSPVPRDHLLLPSHPTPNGRLHLGHIAGPYLKMDVLKRALQRRGGRVSMMFAIDSYDSYILLRAYQSKANPTDVVARYKQEIIDDLVSLDINIDVFIDPLAEEWSNTYRETLVESLAALQSAGALVTRSESFLWCPTSSRFIVGCWLQGRCPGCGCDAGGYSCESCGSHYRPEEVLDSHSRMNEGPVEQIKVRTIFLQIQKIAEFRNCIDEMAMPDSFRRIIRQYLDRSGPSLRVTVPGSWGIPIAVDEEPRPQVAFTGFASLGLLLTYGREYSRRFGGSNAFHFESDVVTVCSFGIDNTVSRIISCIGGTLEYPDHRPPDHLLLNHFYRLEGSKFSTSRGHAIWASAIANITPFLSDAVRLYLIETAPDATETDFRVDDFLKTANNLNKQWNLAIAKAVAAIANTRQSQKAPDGITRTVAKVLDTQDNFLNLGSFRPRNIPEPIYQWMIDQSLFSGEAQYWWLKGLSLIAWPVLPKLSGWLWKHLGHDGVPSESEYLKLTTPDRDFGFEPLEPITLEHLRECLPLSVHL
jgi:methionyl-tRNA synthetase